MHNRPSIDPLKELSPDAYDLVSAMLKRNPKGRPTAKQICEHPFFWNSQKRLSFLCEFSDRLETDAASQTSLEILPALAIERGAVDVVGTSWDRALDNALINNMQRFRTYDPSSVRDLLRLIRNKHHHFDELPSAFRASSASNQDALLQYFEARFPRLIMHCFNCCRQVLTADDSLAGKYCITPFSKPEVKRSSTPDSVVIQKLSVEQHLEVVRDVQSQGLELSETRVSLANNGGYGSETLPQITDTTDNRIAYNGASAATEAVPPWETPKVPVDVTEDIIVWEGSASARTFNCRGWSRSEDEWARRIEPWFRKRDPNLKRALEDPKFRTRLCNHWDESLGTFCPMKKKNKCVFAHGPAELRVKEGKRSRWGKLLDKDGNNSNPWHSGGEDTYGAARSI
jgi:hypothetical protein